MTGGFADPIHDSQAAFRALLEATARPGTIVSLPPCDPPPPLPQAAAAILLALCDRDTPLWLDASFATRTVCEWLRFHTASPLVSDPADASFAFACADSVPFDALTPGTDEAPERSATLVLFVEGFVQGRVLRLSGPGIDSATLIPVDGLSEAFLGWRARNLAFYPRGVDVLLITRTEAIALPRTTVVQEV